MVTKHPINPERIRKIPKPFSWLDHRLVSEHYIDRCTHKAAALYLFLVTVADARGISYYSVQTLSRRLGMDEPALRQARNELASLGLIAYRKPFYQVLAIDADPQRHTGSPQGIEQIFKRIGEGLK
jgi:hypothetical protein